MAAAQFHQISEAYQTLSDPDRRRRYDVGGEATTAVESGATFGFEGFDFSITASGSDASTFGDLFADVLQRGAADGAPERGVDLHQLLSLTFEQAVSGGRHGLTVTRQERC